MTETTTGASFTEDGIADEAEALPRAQRRMAPIVPAQNVAGRALVSVIVLPDAGGSDAGARHGGGVGKTDLA
jgi:hypothetical protein